MMSFTDVVMECIETEGFVEQFNRLSGCNLGQSIARLPANRSPIEMAIDKACGYDATTPESKDDMGKFVAFVFNCVWSRLPPECFALVEVDEDGKVVNNV